MVAHFRKIVTNIENMQNLVAEDQNENQEPKQEKQVTIAAKQKENPTKKQEVTQNV